MSLEGNRVNLEDAHRITHSSRFGNLRLLLLPSQPVCEAVGAHNSLDLTDRPAYVIGRSPCSDMQLFHSTCSRLHAILVHHKNGSCLIKDLQSGHGTFVNGLQVPPNVWSRIKKGSLVRFGGIGGPSFVQVVLCGV